MSTGLEDGIPLEETGMMNGRLVTSIFGTILCVAVGMAYAEITLDPVATATPQAIIIGHPQDDTWAVIEYPKGQEVIVELNPTAMTPTAKGTARVIRSNDETTINLEVTGLTGDATSYQVYAVDSLGNATLLDTLTVTDGSGSLSAKTVLNKFMLVVSPEADLTAIGPETNVTLRSSVPGGFNAVPRPSGEAESQEGVKVALRTEPTATESPEYNVPLLGINSLKRGSDLRMGARFANGYEGARANVNVKPRKTGSTEIKVRLHDLKQAEDGTRYLLWALTPDNSYTMLGQVTRANKPREAKVDAVTPLTDFGLFITAESTDAAPSSPTGNLVATIVR